MFGEYESSKAAKQFAGIIKSRGRRAVRASTKKALCIFDPPKHENGAIYEVNQRNSNVWRIARAAKLRSNS